MDKEQFKGYSVYEELVNFDVNSGFSLLHYYCRENEIKRCEFLLKNGLSPNLTVEFGSNHDVTPLMVACQFNNIKLVELLISCGANCNLSNGQGSTALHYAMFNNSPLLVELLLKYGAEVNAFTAERALWTDEFDSFLFETPLHLAASNGYLDIAKLLVKAGANVNSKGASESTPLMFASAFGHCSLVEYLCNAGADVNCRANQKQNGIVSDYSALHFAARNGHQDIYDTLIKYGANGNAVECNTGISAIEMLNNYKSSANFLNR